MGDTFDLLFYPSPLTYRPAICRLKQSDLQVNSGFEARKDTNDRNDTNDMQGIPGRSLKEMDRTAIKQTLGFEPRVKMRLSEIERVIKKHRIIVPPPSRQTLIKLCEEGVFETVGTGPTIMGWLVFEDSFLRWVRNLDQGDE